MRQADQFSTRYAIGASKKYGSGEQPSGTHGGPQETLPINGRLL